MQGCKSIRQIPGHLRPSLIFICVLPCTGCLLLEKDLTKKPPLGPVSQVHTYWNKEVMRVNQGGVGNSQILPGIAGRLYLMGPDFKHPLGASGNAKVMVEMNYTRPDGSPQRIEYEFPKKHLDKLQSRDLLGWGYTIPLPWMEYHPDIREVTIRVAYYPDKGSPISSMPSTFTLQRQGVMITNHQLPPGGPTPPPAVRPSAPDPFAAAQRMNPPGSQSMVRTASGS